MGLAAAELGGHVEDGRRFGLLARQPTDHLRGQSAEVLGEVRPLEEALWLLIIRRGAAVADLVEVNGELRSVERLALAQVLAGSDDFVPGFKVGHANLVIATA